MGSTDSKLVATEESRNQACPDEEARTKPLEFLAPHPIAKLASHLDDYLGIGTDCISLTMFLSRAAGRLGVPFNLAIFSEDAGTEHLISDRLINIVPETVKHAETIKQFRDLSAQRFNCTELVLVRSLHEGLYRFACETACRDISTTSTPSVWLITDERSTVSNSRQAGIDGKMVYSGDRLRKRQ